MLNRKNSKDTNDRYNNKQQTNERTFIPNYLKSSKNFHLNQSSGAEINNGEYINKTNISELQRNYLPNKNQVFLGTSQFEVQKAMNKYLNQAGAGDYNLPNLTGDNV